MKLNKFIIRNFLYTFTYANHFFFKVLFFFVLLIATSAYHMIVRIFSKSIFFNYKHVEPLEYYSIIKKLRLFYNRVRLKSNISIDNFESRYLYCPDGPVDNAACVEHESKGFESSRINLLLCTLAV